MTDALETVKEAAEKIETMASDAQKSMTEQMEKITKSLEDATAFSQENVDALMKSGELATKAVEGVSAEVSAFSKKTFEEGVAAAKDMAAAKNVTELFEKQSAFAKSSVEGFMKEATKLNEMYIAAAKDSFEPINGRITAATDMVKSFTA